MPNIDDSPIAKFVRNIKAMGEQRKDLMEFGAEFERPEKWRIALEDLAMLTTEKVVIGLRTKWVRRVAVPMVQAYRALIAEGNDLSKARNARAIVFQLAGQDDELMGRCLAWLDENYFAPITQPPPEAEPCLAV